MRIPALLAGVALLSGCATHPITGRNQIAVLPLVQAVHADAAFVLSTSAMRIAALPSCGEDCGSDGELARFSGRVTAIGAQLAASAREMSPELFTRTDGFRIEVNEGLGAGTGSSASGRIAIGAGLAVMEPTDTVIAFLIAREMAHVIARHAEENSGASILFAALGMLLPGVNLIVRFAATQAGSGMLRDSWALQQQREADEIAVALLERSGLSAQSVAFGLQSGVKRVRLPDDDWGVRYVASARRVALIAASSPAAGARSGPQARMESTAY